MVKGVLQICPYEPPASGWTTRVKLLRSTIRERGAFCEILDIGPSRRVPGRECISVLSGRDYIAKLLVFARQKYCVHCHINGEYFRGLLLALAALGIAGIYGNRRVVTFHAGTVQRFFDGWERIATWPFIRLIFWLADVVICNGEAEKRKLRSYGNSENVIPIQAFSAQYLEFDKGLDDPDLDRFAQSHSPLIVSYLCFRDGFYVDEVIEGIASTVANFPNLGLVIVGTGDGETDAKQNVEIKNISANVYFAGDVRHDVFMSLLDMSMLYLRSHIYDGISASVLESLALGTPVLASENGTRPPSVVKYEADDPVDLASKLNSVLTHHDEMVASIESPGRGDTVQIETDLLLDGNGAAATASP